MLNTDILVVGTGIAGLSFAIKTATKRPDLSITIMTKELAEVSNTQFAQGGIAAVLNTVEDSFEQHIADTLKAGGGHSDEEVVRMVVEQAPERLRELIDLGVQFDESSGGYDLALEGGHAHKRILHHGDTTGEEVERALLVAVRSLSNITIFEKHMVIDLLIENKTCTGAFFFTADNKIGFARFRVLVLSTGGCGQLFKYTTNPAIATADGVAIAHRAGAEIADMHYIQFHPTALYEPGKNPSFLLTEALRGSGAHIVNHHGMRFLFQTDARGELATRDIVSGAIGEELRKTGRNNVFLDCRHLDKEIFELHFPAILAYCTEIGLDPFTNLMPIIPVAHYQCGGVVVDKNAQSSVHRLYAVGECARTGLHGKNRLASNSLLEAVVFAHQASEAICSTINEISFCTKVYVNKYGIVPFKLHQNLISGIKQRLQDTLHKFYVEGLSFHEATVILRELKQQAFGLYRSLNVSVELIELLNMLTVASIIVKQAKNSCPVSELSANYSG